jgi:hypothetical protein
VRAFVIRESAPAPALIAAAFIEMAEAPDATMRLIPKAPTAYGFKVRIFWKRRAAGVD